MLVTHIFIFNYLNLFVSLNYIFTAVFLLLSLSSDSPSSCANEVSCAEELSRILALVSLKIGSICLNQSGLFDGARPLPRLIRECNFHQSDFNDLNLLRILVMDVSSFL